MSNLEIIAFFSFNPLLERLLYSLLEVGTPNLLFVNCDRLSGTGVISTHHPPGIFMNDNNLGGTTSEYASCTKKSFFLSMISSTLNYS